MNYPIWLVPFLGGSWIIGIISIIHIFISHFAVGSGFYLALTERKAYKENDEGIYDYLKKHTRFFVLVTTAGGAITGVGIWFSVSLVSPDTIAILIQNFAFAWAWEYLFFAAEIATAFAYYYTWDKVSKEIHLKLANLYLWFSVFTLVIINGILTFMLTPGKWIQTHNWLDGFLNPTYFPSLFIRILIMLAIAGIYALVTSSRIKDDNLREKMVKYSAKWLMPVFVAGPIIGFWYFTQIPHETIMTIANGIQTSGVGNFSILTRATYLSLILSGTIVVFAYVGPYLNPKGFTFGISLMFLLCGFMVTGTTEWMREMLRKPYTVYNYIYSNGVKKDEILNIDKMGFLKSGKWANACASKTDNDIQKGQIIFRYECMSCHTVDGYRSMKKLLGTRDQDAIIGFLNLLHQSEADKNPYHGIMPPFAGSDEDIHLLSSYLYSINNSPNSSDHKISSR